MHTKSCTQESKACTSTGLLCISPVPFIRYFFGNLINHHYIFGKKYVKGSAQKLDIPHFKTFQEMIKSGLKIIGVHKTMMMFVDLIFIISTNFYLQFT